MREVLRSACVGGGVVVHERQRPSRFTRRRRKARHLARQPEARAALVGVRESRDDNQRCNDADEVAAPRATIVKWRVIHRSFIPAPSLSPQLPPTAQPCLSIFRKCAMRRRQASDVSSAIHRSLIDRLRASALSWRRLVSQFEEIQCRRVHPRSTTRTPSGCRSPGAFAYGRARRWTRGAVRSVADPLRTRRRVAVGVSPKNLR